MFARLADTQSLDIENRYWYQATLAEVYFGMQDYAKATEWLDKANENKPDNHRLGELYESELYQKVEDGPVSDYPRTMPKLLVNPKGAPDSESIKPKYSNCLGRAKVPILVLNSTSLHSDHNWQFSAR